MKKTAFALLVALLCSFGLSAQKKSGKDTQDVVYLKNGGLIRGTITELVPDEKVAIMSVGGNIFVFEMAEVERIAREGGAYENAFGRPPASYRKKGLFFAAELGFVAGWEFDYGSWKARALQQVAAGYMFHPRIAAGLGAGLTWYGDGPMIPIFLQLRGNLSRQAPLALYYFADVGYGIATKPGNDYYYDTTIKAKGGLKSAVGVGVKVSGRKGMGWTLSMGYHLQKAETTQTYTQWDGTSSQLMRSLTHRKVEMKTGFWF